MNRFNSLFWIVLLALVFIPHCTNSGQSETTKPENVYRIVYQVKPNEWYVKQAELWKKEIEKNPKNTEAWYNYYNANRYARYEETIDTKDKKTRLEKIIEDMGQAIPGTYEYFLLKHWNTFNLTDMSLIEKAYQLEPKRVDTYYAFISHYEFTGQEKKLEEFCEKLYESKDIAPGLVNYNYNVLMSTGENAILFTNGDNDTYPPWMLQKALNIRKDVTVLNIPISTRTKKSYLERKLKDKKISIDFDELPDLMDENFLPELCKSLTAKYPDIPIYFALTVNEYFTKALTDDLYIVGLAYQYSPKRIDNLALLKKNLEKNLRLDYLTYDWYDESYLAKDIIATMNTNYVAPMIMLAEHYMTSSEDEKAEEWKDLVFVIALRSGKKGLTEEIEKKFPD
jgi:hypothetical protein